MTGATPSTGYVLATRVKFSGEPAGDATFLYADDGAGYDIEVGFSPSTGSNKFLILFLTQNIAAVDYEWIATTEPTEFIPDTWYSILIKVYTDSGDTGYPLEVWINGVEITMDATTWDGTGQLVAWDDMTAWQVGNFYGDEVVSSRFIWFEPSLTGDPSYSDFFEANNCVRDLGVDGSVPTGSQPMIYMAGGSVDYQDNKGYGGAFPISFGTIYSGSYTCP